MRNFNWVIMSARNWLGKPDVNKIIKENGSDCTILAVLKEGKPYFILGGIGNYGFIGKTYRYVIDTGLGHGAKGSCEIQNIIHVKNGIPMPQNEIGLKEKRFTYVFK